LLSVGALLPFLSFAERGVFCAAKQVGFPNSVTLCPNICFLKKLVSSLKKLQYSVVFTCKVIHQPCKQEAAKMFDWKKGHDSIVVGRLQSSEAENMPLPGLPRQEISFNGV